MFRVERPFVCLSINFGETGSILVKKRNVKRRVLTEELEEIGERTAFSTPPEVRYVCFLF